MKIKVPDNLLYCAAILARWRDNRDTSLEKFDKNKVRKIVLVLTTGLGDTILSTPAIRAARHNFQHATIKLFVRERWHTLFENDPYLDGLILYHGKHRRLISTIKLLREERPDLALIFHGNDPDIIPLMYCSGAPFIVRVPNDTTRFRFLLSNQEAGATSYLDPQGHYIENRLKIFNLIGCSAGDTKMYLTIGQDVQAKVDRIVEAWRDGRRRRLVGVHIFAADDYKVWPVGKQAEFLEKITSLSEDVAPVLTGGRSDRKRIEGVIRRLSNGDRIINAAGVFSPIETAALMKRLTLFVTPDTGLLHMAVAVGTPTISLFAPTDHRLIGPLYDRQRHLVIQKAPACEYCSTKACKKNTCMDEISVDEVFEALLRAMKIRNDKQ